MGGKRAMAEMAHDHVVPASASEMHSIDSVHVHHAKDFAVPPEGQYWILTYPSRLVPMNEGYPYLVSLGHNTKETRHKLRFFGDETITEVADATDMKRIRSYLKRKHQHYRRIEGELIDHHDGKVITDDQGPIEVKFDNPFTSISESEL